MHLVVRWEGRINLIKIFNMCGAEAFVCIHVQLRVLLISYVSSPAPQEGDFCNMLHLHIFINFKRAVFQAKIYKTATPLSSSTLSLS